jgi:hypothetical protein
VGGQTGKGRALFFKGGAYDGYRGRWTSIKGTAFIELFDTDSGSVGNGCAKSD